jgi:hypothetical protein
LQESLSPGTHNPAQARPSTQSELTRPVASLPALWQPLLRHDPAHRWFERLISTDVVELWLIGWSAGQSTPLSMITAEPQAP